MTMQPRFVPVFVGATHVGTGTLLPDGTTSIEFNLESLGCSFKVENDKVIAIYLNGPFAELKE